MRRGNSKHSTVSTLAALYRLLPNEARRKIKAALAKSKGFDIAGKALGVSGRTVRRIVDKDAELSAWWQEQRNG